MKNKIIYLLLASLVGFILYDKSEEITMLFNSSSKDFDCPEQEFFIDRRLESTSSQTIDVEYEVTQSPSIRKPLLNSVEEAGRSLECNFNRNVEWEAYCEITNLSQEKGEFIILMDVRKNNNNSQEQIEKRVVIDAGGSKIVSGVFEGKCNLTHIVDINVTAPKHEVESTVYETIKEKVIAKKIKVKSGRSKIILRTKPVFDKTSTTDHRVNDGDELLFTGETRSHFELETKRGEFLEGQFIQVSRLNDMEKFWVFSAYFECVE